MKVSLILLSAAGLLSGQMPSETTPLRSGMSWKYRIDYSEYMGARGYVPYATGTRSLRIDSVSESGPRIAWVTVRDSGSELIYAGREHIEQETRYRFTEDAPAFRMELLDGPPPLFGWLPRYFYKAPILSPDAPIPLRIRGDSLALFRLLLPPSLITDPTPYSMTRMFPNMSQYDCARSVGAIRLYEVYGFGSRPGGGFFNQVLIEHNGKAFDYTEALRQFDSARGGSNAIPWETLAVFPSDIEPWENWHNALGIIGNRLVFSGEHGTFTAPLRPERGAGGEGWRPVAVYGRTDPSIAFNGTRLFASTPGGTYVSDDAGERWRYSDGKCAEAQLNAYGDLILAFSYQELCLSRNGGEDWDVVTPPDYERPNYRYPAAYAEPVLRINYRGRFEETRDYGKSWKRVGLKTSIRGAFAFNHTRRIRFQ